MELWRPPTAILVESPFWDARTQRMVWVDISAGRLHLAGEPDTVVDVGPPLASVQPTDGDGFVAALGDRVVLLDSAGRIDRVLASVQHAHSGMRLNEGKCDPFGAFVVGSMDLTTGDPDGAVYRIRSDGSCNTMLSGFGVTNGIDFSPTGDVMYVTDTSVKTVYRVAYGPDGVKGELEPFLVGRSSDGLAMDTDGGFWNGCYGEGVIVHWTAEGVIDRELPVPSPNVTGVAFGGPRLDRLYVGTARENLTERQLEDAPLSGGVFIAELGATGREPLRFATVV